MEFSCCYYIAVTMPTAFACPIFTITVNERVFKLIFFSQDKKLIQLNIVLSTSVCLKNFDKITIPKIRKLAQLLNIFEMTFYFQKTQQKSANVYRNLEKKFSKVFISKTKNSSDKIYNKYTNIKKSTT
ncbi:hypothetical protein RFI_06078 [Reticulomyxa filosa]|uniref:Uncharacterized protein n=1 Tax=Reticulomyxa filosa TaxID=46433 RepID=X6NYH5_RETFI|nr:hypothetical protein RFI_06078 [Reticulomyxa filosa]|eukprot:ETO31041.1 hypothetical protein RFI_06078 [Reticulomyxa filosa]